MNPFLRYWLPVILWAGFIFGMSTSAGAPRNTSRIIRPLALWLNPNLSEAALAKIEYGIRKAAHVTEYALFTLLLWRARRRPVWHDPRPWQLRDAAFAILLAVLFAATDEWHQTFVPEREGRPQDVLIDGAGAVAAMLGLWCFCRWNCRVPVSGNRQSDPSHK